ncbi:MAG TPA: hypothetical protein VJN21_12015 [Candidatus Acidoferrales bacterium]|nr:hypothetical protein [Candidatus Acidoferrales bacterium]
MHRTVILVSAVLLSPMATFAQSASSDSRTLQQLLFEVRQLRQELRTSMVNTQRAQLLFFRMQAQQTAVARAQQRVDAANSALDKAQRTRNGIENELKYDTERVTEEQTPNAVERQQIEAELPRIKEQFDSAAAAEQQAQGSVMAAKDQLQLEQGKLDGLQAELDQIDKSLEQFAKQTANEQ